MTTLRGMTETGGPLARAIELVAAGGALEVDDVASLGPVLRSLRPVGAPGAGADVVDVDTLAAILRRRPGLLAERAGDVALAVDADAFVPARGEGPRRRAAQAVLDAAVLALEAKKLAFGLQATPQDLKRVFSSPDEARAVLEAVVALDGRVVVSGASPGRVWSPSLPADREVHVVAGAGARRLLDLIAPSVRRLRVELALVGRRGAVVDEEDVYRGLARLHDSDPATVAERRARDADDGVIEVDDGGGFVVDAASLAEELVDRRARSLIMPLKKARAGIVGVVDSADLARLLAALGQLGAVPRSITLLVPATSTTDDDDGAVVDAASAHVWPGTSAGATLSVPLLEVAPAGVAADEDAFILLQAVAAAGLEQTLPSPTLHRVVGDDSGAALRALAAMVQVRPR